MVEHARDVAKLNAANLRRRQERLRESQQTFQSFLGQMLGFTLSVGLLVAIVSTSRVSILEGRAERQRRELERAEDELRRLSRNLVQAQEAERKSLSRELHDAIGQMLTGMGMELANIESQRTSSPEKCHAHLEEARRLNAETLRSVRDLAMGLRPSMLDDLGLGPALEWQGREFSRRSGVPVSVQIDGVMDPLPETHRTSIYRVVQEALTNCGRHARAKSIRVSVHGAPDRVSLTIQDDGVGFDPGAARGKGLGLLGIQERVRELGGTLEIVSQPHKGTMLKVEVPAAGEASA
jgi:signal transduction histidine kinase